MAEAAGRILVERRLAACVNILPGMTSIYCWEGALERGEEAVMIIKTRAALADDVTRAVKELHSYKTPAILVMLSGERGGIVSRLAAGQHGR